MANSFPTFVEVSFPILIFTAKTLHHPDPKSAIRRTLEAMGPKRVRRGLTAFEDVVGNRSDWDECFIGRAMSYDVDYHYTLPLESAARILGISQGDLRPIVCAFDGCSCSRDVMSTAELKKMAESYLAEQDAIAEVTAPLLLAEATV